MPDKLNIADLRQEYARNFLTEDCVEKSPVAQFKKWFQEALHSQIPEPNAMTLATCGADMQPSARIVLLKGFDERGFVFFSNYNSHKGHDLAENPKAALTFLWLGLERQVRIEGTTEKVSEQESDEYFNSRPIGSRLGAWSSPQSESITKEELIAQENFFKEKFKEEDTIPRPQHWGGYRIKPCKIEFWQGRPSRLHDRILYVLDESGNWNLCRLAP